MAQHHGLPKEFEEFSLEIAIPKKVQVGLRERPYESAGGYHQNLAEQTCSCHGSVEVRQKHCTPDFMGRFCKHLAAALDARGAFEQSDQWIKEIVKAGFGGPFFAFELGTETAGTVLITVGPGNEWLNVFARFRRNGQGPIHQFGWHIASHGWSYGTAPGGASEIRSFLELFDHISFDPIADGASQTEMLQRSYKKPWWRFWK